MPELSRLAVRPLTSSGSSNALFLLGDELLVRLLRQPGGSASIEKGARWLPVVRRAVSTATPEVVAVGDPGFGYPERWAVTTWLDGEVPQRPQSHTSLAEDLAQIVAELRALDVPATAYEDPDLSSYRGGLPAENLLVRDGRLAAVLDFGGLGVGDPSVDLMVAWEVLDAEGRQTFRRALAVDDQQWAKGRGWALLVAMITFPYYWDTMPERCATRRTRAMAALAG